jgi:hypothetical protein
MPSIPRPWHEALLQPPSGAFPCFLHTAGRPLPLHFAVPQCAFPPKGALSESFFLPHFPAPPRFIATSLGSFSHQLPPVLAVTRPVVNGKRR